MTLQYYINSLNPENEGISLDRFLELNKINTERQEEQDKTPQKIEQTKLSAFFEY